MRRCFCQQVFDEIDPAEDDALTRTRQVWKQPRLDRLVLAGVRWRMRPPERSAALLAALCAVGVAQLRPCARAPTSVAQAQQRLGIRLEGRPVGLPPRAEARTGACPGILARPQGPLAVMALQSRHARRPDAPLGAARHAPRSRRVPGSRAGPDGSHGPSALGVRVAAQHGMAPLKRVLLEACAGCHLGVALGSCPWALALLGLTAPTIMRPHEALEARAPDRDALLGSQAVGHLLGRELGPRAGSVQGRTGRVLLSHLETGRVHLGEQRMTRRAAATCSPEARWRQDRGSGEVLPPWGQRRPITGEEARASTEATTPERAGCDRGLSAPVFGGEALVKHAPLRCDSRTVAWPPRGSPPMLHR